MGYYHTQLHYEHCIIEIHRRQRVHCWVLCPISHRSSPTVLAGGMLHDLTTAWYRAGWWNAPWFDHHVVPCWLVECSMIWPTRGTVLAGGMLHDLTIMCYCADGGQIMAYECSLPHLITADIAQYQWSIPWLILSGLIAADISHYQWSVPLLILSCLIAADISH